MPHLIRNAFDGGSVPQQLEPKEGWNGPVGRKIGQSLKKFLHKIYTGKMKAKMLKDFK